MKILIDCPNCEQITFFVRTSEKMSRITRKTVAHCRNCNAELTVISEVVKCRLPTYQDTPEALTANKPYCKVDPNQTELPLDNQS